MQGAAAISSVEFLLDGRHVIAGGDMRTWDIEKARLVATLEGGALSNAATSPDSRLVFAGAEDGSVHSWEARTGKVTGHFTGHLPLVRAVAVSPDGKTLAVGSGHHQRATGEVRLWDIASGQERGHWGIAKPVFCLGFSPDGNSLAVGAQAPELKIFDVKTRKEQASLSNPIPLHAHGIIGIAYAPDGRTIASIGNWGEKYSLLVWEISKAKASYELPIPGPIRRVAFAADGRHLAIANGNGTIYILRLVPRPS